MYRLFTTSRRVIAPLLTIAFLSIIGATDALSQPVFMGFPDDVTVECDQIPPKTKPMATGNCLPINIALSEYETVGACAQVKIIERVFTATDNCGQSLQQTQRITVQDTKAPVLKFSRPDLIGKKHGDTLILDCKYAYGLGPKDAYATDNCDGAPSAIIFKDNLIRAGDCGVDGYLLFMNCSWIATDACGNSSEIALYVKFIDTTPPDIWGVPADIITECEGQVVFDKKPYFKDYCDGQPTMSEEIIRNSGVCAGTYNIIRRWTATDACGNKATAQQTISINDIKAPKITKKPQDITIQQGESIPSAGTVTAEDNCGGDYIQKVTDVKTALSCDSLITRTWEVKDLCGNSTLATQKITIAIKKASIGNIVLDSVIYCLGTNPVIVNAKHTQNPVTPLGYKVKYLWADKNGTIINVTDLPNTQFSATGQFTLHVLVYNTLYNPATIIKDSTTIGKVAQDIASTCAILNIIGEKFTIKICNIIPNDPACVPPTISAINIEQTKCDTPTGKITLDVSTSNVTYKWSNGATTASINQLNEGQYTVTITKVSDARCAAIATYIVSSKNDIKPALPSILPSVCGGKTGEVVFPDSIYTYTWADGTVSAKRQQLAAGVYYVTATKGADLCKTVIPITIKENSFLTAYAEILKKPDCNGNNGSAKITVEGGSGKKTFSWGASEQRNNLIAGVYSVTVTDENGCEAIAAFVLPNAAADSTNTIQVSVDKNNCSGTLATATIDVVLSATFSGPAIIKIVNAQNKVYAPTDLPTGEYFVLLFDNNECLVQYKAFSVQLPAALEISSDVEEALCKGNITINVKGGTSPYTYDWADITGTADSKDRISIKPGVYNLTVTDTKGCSATINATVTKETCEDTCINWIPERNLTLSSDDCEQGIKWCVNIPFDIYKTKISTLINNQGYNGQVSICRLSPSDSVGYTQLTLPVGKHTVVFTQQRGKNTCRDTVDVTVICDNCPKIYTAATTVTADSCNGTARVCLDVTKKYLTQVKITNKNQPYNEPIGECASGKAELTLKPGKYEFEFKDTLWSCDIRLNLTVRCDTLKDTPVNSLVIEKTMCIGDTLSVCLDTTELNRGPFKINNLCDNGYKAIQYEVKGLCVKIKADTLGSESLCMYICDPYRRCDTTYIVLNVIPKPNPTGKIDTLYREIEETKKDTVCILTKNLVSVDTIFNYCESSSGKAVKFSLTAKDKCITYEGLKVGLEKGCFVACDKTTGRCDTTIVFVKIKKPKDNTNPDDSLKRKLPVALKDTASTVLETSVAIAVLKNDTIRGALKQLKVFKLPIYGDVYYQNDNTLNYIPKPNTCNVIDTFRYFIENEYGKDSATVCVTVTCSRLVIFNGFSPNEDGVNDVFTVLGIEDNPDNTVKIFNRWGNQVFRTDGYTNRNGWDGRWEGQPLPDATYFYIVELPRLNKIYTGYVELRR